MCGWLQNAIRPVQKSQRTFVFGISDVVFIRWKGRGNVESIIFFLFSCRNAQNHYSDTSSGGANAVMQMDDS